MDEDYENTLLSKIKNRDGDTEKNVFELAVLYQRMGRPEEAVPYIQELINNTDDSEHIAQFYTNLG